MSRPVGAEDQHNRHNRRPYRSCGTQPSTWVYPWHTSHPLRNSPQYGCAHHPRSSPRPKPAAAPSTPGPLGSECTPFPTPTPPTRGACRTELVAWFLELEKHLSSGVQCGFRGILVVCSPFLQFLGCFGGSLAVSVVSWWFRWLYGCFGGFLAVWVVSGSFSGFPAGLVVFCLFRATVWPFR